MDWFGKKFKIKASGESSWVGVPSVNIHDWVKYMLPPQGAPGHTDDEKGQILWLVVVDGRQRRYSEGMNMHELASVMKELGCWTATNMDGGGSSIMGLVGKGGKLKVMNRPSGRSFGRVKIRPLPMVLTITKSENFKE